MSDNAFLAQRFDLRGTDAQPVAENLRVVPSEHRRSQRTPRGTVDPHRSGRHLEVAVLGVMDRLQDAALFKVRIVLNLPRVQDRTGRNSDVADKLHRLLLLCCRVHWLTITSTSALRSMGASIVA